MHGNNCKHSATKISHKGYEEKYLFISRLNYVHLLVQAAGFYKKNRKLIFFCKHFISRLRNSPLRTEYNDLHDQEDYRMTFLDHPSVWR